MLLDWLLLLRDSGEKDLGHIFPFLVIILLSESVML